jgi:hypothetical protein
MATTVPMLAPDGRSGEIPVDKVNEARAAGFKVAVTMKSPDGQTGYIPTENVHAAAAKGFTMVPTSAPDAVKASYWEALTNPIGSGGQEQGVLGAIKQTGGQAIKAMVQPVVHPIDTLAGLYNTVRHPVDTAQAMAGQVKSDYAQGGAPLAAENLAGQVIGAVESGRIAAPIARAAIKAAPAGVGRAVLLGKTPEAAYESAMKPSTTLSQADRAAMVKTGLENSIPVSKGGLEKIGGMIDDLNDKIKAEIAADPTRPVSTVRAVRNLDNVRARFANQVTPQPDLNEISQVQSNFLKNPKVAPQGAGPSPGSLPAADAQAMKSGTYRALGDKAYGELKGANIEAQKALARGLKDEIATQFPEISGLNAAESKLLDLQPVLEKAVNRISNHQIVGIGTPIAGAATTAVTGSTTLGKVGMVVKAVLDNPNVKSRLAIAVSKGGKIPYSQALARVQSYATSLGALSSASQENAGTADTPSQ